MPPAGRKPSGCLLLRIMSDSRPNQEELRPLNVVMTFAVIATIAAVCFLTSPPPERTQHGSIPWAHGSILKALTDALAFDFSIPTPLGIGVKNLAFGLGSAAATIICAVGIFAAGRSREHDFTLEEEEPTDAKPSHLKRQIEPLQGAQFLLGGVVILSFVSSLWSPISEVAIGGSLLLLGSCAWAFAIRFGLNARSCKVAAVGITIVLAATAALAVAYYYERNQSLRVGYPIGNPLFFAACMIPAALLCLCSLAAGAQRLARDRARAAGGMVLSIAALVPILWGLRLADPRSTYIALGVGMAGILFFAVRGIKAKSMVVGAFAAVGVAGFFVWLGPLLAHRSETVRTRLYAWEYAQALIADAPVFGHGEGGFAMLGDALAVADVADDPRALHAHLAHAHNEWLEVAVDLGSIGLVMLLGCYVLTLWAGVRALRAISDPDRRWLLIGLLCSLGAMIVEECFDVALRIAGLPTIFYAVLGITWALISSTDSEKVSKTGSQRKPIAQALVLAGALLVGMVICVSAIRDFRASRALYTFREKLQQRQWDGATEDAAFASRYRLSPHRKLGAYYSHAWSQLSIAQELLRDFLEKGAQRAGSQDAGQAARLQASARRAIDYAQRAIELVEKPSQHIPNYSMQRVVGSAYDVMMRFAAFFGDEGRAEQYRQAALRAFEQDLLRQPHDAMLAWRVIEFSPELPLANTIELICPPMRYHQVELHFYQLVQNLAQQPSFDEAYQPILTQALAALVSDPSEGSPASYPAQKIRIAAWVAVGRGQLSEAMQYARSALVMAEREKDKFPIAYAIAHRELAHFTFMDRPDDPETAITMARQARAALPKSHEAAPAQARITSRLALYYLAKGDEQAARALLPNVEVLTPDAVDAELMSSYLALCQLLVALPLDKRPAYLAARLDRLVKLSMTPQVAPELRPTPLMLQARMAYENQAFADCVEHWSAALSAGVSLVEMYSLVQQAAQAHPAEPAIQQFHMELIALLTGPPAPGGS